MKTTSASLTRSDTQIVLLLVAAMVLTLLGCLESAHPHQPGTATAAAAYELETTLARVGEQAPTLTLPAERAFPVRVLLVCQFLAVLSVALLRFLPPRLVPASVAPSRASPHVPPPDDLLSSRVRLQVLLGCFRE